MPNWTVDDAPLKLVGAPTGCTATVKAGLGDRSGLIVSPCGDTGAPKPMDSPGADGGSVVELLAVDEMLTGSISVPAEPLVSLPTAARSTLPSGAIAKATGAVHTEAGSLATHEASSPLEQIGSSTALYWDGAATEKLVSAQHAFSLGQGEPEAPGPAGPTSALPTYASSPFGLTTIDRLSGWDG